MGQIGFGVLGPLQMTVDGAPVSLGTPKQRAVLAMLVMNRNRPVSTDSLITAAWEDWPPAEARASLHSYISNLRRLMSSAGADPKTVLVNAPPGYRLNVADSACDIGRFVAEKAAGVQAAAAGRFEEASRHLSAALAEWRGAVLEDLRDLQFVEAFATALTEDKVVAHTARAEAEIACGRAYAVVGELETLTVEHPYREPLWAQLITAYYVCERQSDALEAYQRLKTTLADDLGIDPGPTVRALHERILRQESLDVKKTAKTTAVHTVSNIGLRTSVNQSATPARLSANRSRHQDRSAFRQRHRARRRQRQPPPRRHHRHRYQLRDHRSAIGEWSRCGPGENSRHRNAVRRRQDPHLRPRIHHRDHTAQHLTPH
jgi:DNA-binding SARP family transcriptional activator